MYLIISSIVGGVNGQNSIVNICLRRWLDRGNGDHCCSDVRAISECLKIYFWQCLWNSENGQLVRKAYGWKSVSKVTRISGVQRVARKQSQKLGTITWYSAVYWIINWIFYFCRIWERQQGATCATPSAKSLTTYGGSNLRISIVICIVVRVYLGFFPSKNGFNSSTFNHLELTTRTHTTLKNQDIITWKNKRVNFFLQRKSKAYLPFEMKTIRHSANVNSLT